MSYQQDFTIGLKETQDFYTVLVLRRWGKGIVGFAAVGALAALLYTTGTALSMPVRAALIVLGALIGAEVTAVALIFSTRRKVKSQTGRSESYVQSTEINGFGIHVTVGKNKARMGFENLLRVKETRKAFYLFLSEQQAWILPKKQMENPEVDSEQLRRLFRTVIERRRLDLRR